MKDIKELIKENELDLSTLVVFTRLEYIIHKTEYKTIMESGLTTAQFYIIKDI